MNITLVYPGIALIGFNSLGKGVHDTNALNLGLAYIGAYLKKNSRHNLNLIDLRDLRNFHDFEGKIKIFNPDLVGVYFNTVSYEYGLRCAEICKNLGKIVVGGGPHATIFPEELVGSGFVDYIIVGEGEKTFLRLIQDIENKNSLPSILNGEKTEDLDTLPFPDRELYNLKRILNSYGIFPYLNRYLGVIATRGCPFNCAFCQPLEKRLFGDRIRTRTTDNVLEEIGYIVEKYKVDFIMFEDDTFTAKKKWALEMCEKIARENFKIQFGIQSRTDIFDEDLAKSLRKAGCIVVFFGFESGSQKILDFLRKGTKVKQSLEAAKLCKKYNILIFANYMLGIPAEEEEDLQATLEMLKNIKPEMHSPAYFSPIPGSELYDYCKENNLLKVKSYEGFSRNPINEKIEGIDYLLLNKYRRRMLKYSTRWFESSYFMEITLRRWFTLLKRGFIIQPFKEFMDNTPIINLPVKLGRKLKSFIKRRTNLKNGVL